MMGGSIPWALRRRPSARDANWRAGGVVSRRHLCCCGQRRREEIWLVVQVVEGRRSWCGEDSDDVVASRLHFLFIISYRRQGESGGDNNRGGRLKVRFVK